MHSISIVTYDQKGHEYAFWPQRALCAVADSVTTAARYFCVDEYIRDAN